MLRSAQRRDESGRRELNRIAKPPHPNSASRNPDRGLELAVRLDRRGNVVNSRGDAGSFAELVAYAARLAQLIGSDLGLERLVAAECSSERMRYLVHVEESGHVLALKARSDTDLSRVRSRFGL